jgi:hypothetical protein
VRPAGYIGRDAVLAVVEKDDHAIGVHGLANEELVVLEVGDDLLGKGRAVGESVQPSPRGKPSVYVDGSGRSCGADECMVHAVDSLEGEANLRLSLKVLDLSIVGALCLHGFLNLLHVRLEMREVALLVELRLVQAEGVGNVEHGLLGVLEVVSATILSRGVGADVDVLAADSDLLAIGLVDGAVDFLEVVGVGDDLVIGDDVLWEACLALLGLSS